MIKRIPKQIDINLPIVKLYLDDLEEISNTLAKSLNGEITYSTCDHLLSNIEEFSQLPQTKSNELIIDFENFRIFIYSNHGNIRVYGNPNNLERKGLATEIHELFQLKKRPILSLIHYNLKIKFITSFAITFLFILFIANPFLSSINLSGIVGATFSALVLITTVTIIDKFGNVIYFTYRKDNPNFFSRNKDDIIKMVLAAIFGGLITYLITTLLP